MGPRSPHRAAAAPPRGLLLLLAFLSGLSALVYESIWIRWFRLLFGSTTAASSVTLSAFFGGLALGAWWFGRRSSGSVSPLRDYARIELGVALAALWVPVAVLLYEPLYPLLYEHLGGRRGVFTAAKLFLALAAMLPSAILMGGTLPMLGAALLGDGAGSLGKLGNRLYALNTVGAAVGAALGALLLPEWVGVPAAYGVAVVLTLGVAGAAHALARRVGPRAPGPDEAGSAERAGTAPLAIAFASGLGVLAFEVLLIHALGQLFSHSAYSVGLVLLAVLLCLAVGAALVSASEGRARPATLLRWSLVAEGALLLAFPWALRSAGRLSFGLALAILLVGALVFPLTFRMVSGGHAGRRIGGLLAANTVGGILGSAGVSFVLLPTLGLWDSLGGLGVLYVAAALAVAGAPRARLAAGLGAVAAVALAALTPLSPWRVRDVTLAPGERLLALEEGATGIVSVVETADGNRRIKVDDVYQFGDSKEVGLSERLGHVPLLLHPAPRSVAFVGSATGGVAGSALLHPVERIDMVEIVPEVQALAAEWFAATNRGVHHDPRTRLVTEDGRNHLRATAERYDVIVEDCFVPYRPSAASMYTREHYRDARERLTERGVFCQWLPVYQLDGPSLRIIVATFLAEFPDGALWRPHVRAHFPVLGLVGCRGDFPSAAEVEARTADLAALGIGDPWVTDPEAVWLLYVAPAARVFDGEERPRPHRDGHPYFEFVTARFDPAEVHRFRYVGWVALNDRLARAAPERDPLFPGRPRAHALGANALIRANLAMAGGVERYTREAWAEAREHLPGDVLALRDGTFSDVWAR